LLGVSYLTAATSASWGGSTGRVHNFIFQDENPRYNLNWFCLAVVLLKALF
jgi:cytochrome oxidase assembly protein ShyY1